MRFRPFGPALLIGLAIAALAGGDALAQAAIPLTPRNTSDDSSDEAARAEKERKTQAARTPSRIGGVPTFGNRPGFGAGTTGFRSNNSRKTQGKGIQDPLDQKSTIAVPAVPTLSRNGAPSAQRLQKPRTTTSPGDSKTASTIKSTSTTTPA